MKVEKFLMPNGDYCNKLISGTTEVIVPEKVAEVYVDEEGTLMYKYKGFRHYNCGQEEVRDMIRIIHSYERIVKAFKNESKYKF